MNIFCVIPAYNEAGTISEVVRKAGKYASNIVVVDDASADDTSDLAASAGAIVLRHIVNRDQGAALETGTRFALEKGADIIIHFDADGQFLAEDIPAMVAPILDGSADAVFGSRFLGKRSEMPAVKKYVIMPIARMVNRAFFGIRMTDPQSGFRALSRATAGKLSISNDGKAHCSEILYKVKSGGARIKEVPITVLYHRYGQDFSGGVRIIKDLFLNWILE